ncbi:hypothetical protein D3C85_1831870 [compost metagenome]
MNIACRDMYIRDDVVFVIHGTMIQVEEALWLSVTNHVSALRIGCAHFDLFSFLHFLSRFQRLFSKFLPILLNRYI